MMTTYAPYLGKDLPKDRIRGGVSFATLWRASPMATQCVTPVSVQCQTAPCHRPTALNPASRGSGRGSGVARGSPPPPDGQSSFKRRATSHYPPTPPPDDGAGAGVGCGSPVAKGGAARGAGRERAAGAARQERLALYWVGWHQVEQIAAPQGTEGRSAPSWGELGAG